MIKYESTKGRTSIECGGPLHEIDADILSLIHLTYNGINDQSEKAAEAFKDMITKNVALAFNSEEDISEELEKLREKRVEKCEEAKADLADALKGLVDELFS